MGGLSGWAGAGKRLERMAHGRVERMAGDREKAGAKAGAAAKKI